MEFRPSRTPRGRGRRAVLSNGSESPAPAEFRFPCEAAHRAGQRIVALSIPPYRNDAEPLPEDFWG